jgi:hypothetical protein
VRAPRLLPLYVWGYGRETPLLWRGHRVGLVSGNRVEAGRRKMAEAGRGLNLSKCRILIHPDSADLVVWPSTLPPPTYPLLPVVSKGMKLLGAPISPEIFRQEFVETRVRKVTASVPCLEKLAPWATWSLLQYCVNERINYLAQVTEFPLVQDSLALMDEIIDNAIIRASGLPIASPDSLTHLTTFTLRSLPCDLGGLGTRHFGVLAGRGRTVLYKFAETHTPQLLEGITLDFWWPPIVLGAAENRVWTAVAGLFRPESDFDDGTTEEPTPSDPNIFGLSTSPVGGFRPSATLSIWTTLLLIARHGARESS